MTPNHEPFQLAAPRRLCVNGVCVTHPQNTVTTTTGSQSVHKGHVCLFLLEFQHRSALKVLAMTDRTFSRRYPDYPGDDACEAADGSSDG